MLLSSAPALLLSHTGSHHHPDSLRLDTLLRPRQHPVRVTTPQVKDMQVAPALLLSHTELRPLQDNLRRTTPHQQSLRLDTQHQPQLQLVRVTTCQVRNILAAPALPLSRMEFQNNVGLRLDTQLQLVRVVGPPTLRLAVTTSTRTSSRLEISTPSGRPPYLQAGTTALQAALAGYRD